MTVTFWGVRGSIPSPLTPKAYRERLSAVIHRIQPRDLESPRSRERFLANLPPELGDLIGGNTTCLEVRSEKGDLLIVDCGTGLRELANNLVYDKEQGIHAHIFFTHFHWDHLQGIPFCSLFFNPRNRITFYSKSPKLKEILEAQMREPYFPVPMSVFNASFEYVVLDNDPIQIHDLTVKTRDVYHPGGCVSYRFEEYGKALIFSTDTELQTSDFIKTRSNMNFYGKTDVLVFDTQYTLGEAIDKLNWGHTAFSSAVDFATEYGIPKLYLFHHDPNYSDAAVEELNRLALWYAHKRPDTRLEVRVAREGDRICL